MAGKSYKQLYEETKAMLDRYQDEIVPKLREENPQTISDEEIFALEAVAYGCNTNKSLQSVAGDVKYLCRGNDKTVTFKEALVTVYNLIKRLKWSE